MNWSADQVAFVPSADNLDYGTWHVVGRKHTRVSLGKAAHRCHGWLPCVARCVLVGPWIVEPARPVRGGWFKNERGEWMR